MKNILYSILIIVAFLFSIENIKADPIVIITSDGPVNFCPGDSVKLSVILCSGCAGPNTYLWTLNDTTIIDSTEFITAKKEGVYSVRVTCASGCKTTCYIKVTLNCPCVSSVLVDSLLMNTGYDHSGNTAYTNFVPDGGWTVVSTPLVVDFPKPYSAWTIFKYNSWHNPLANSQWISAIDNQEINYTNPAPDSLPYIFKYGFCLCQDDSVTFNFDAMADDSAVVYLSDDPFNNLATINSFTTPQHFNTKRFLKAGKHFLVAFLRNLHESAMGLDIAGTVKSPHLIRWNHCDSIPVIQGPLNNTNSTLNLKIILEGYYIGVGQMNGILNITGVSADPLDADSIFISAMDPNSPYAEVDRQPGILKTNGDVTVTFGSAVVANSSYYLKINHRNSVETWSAAPVLLTAITSYSFSSSTSQAFLSNEAETFDALYAAIYTGDINQDGAVDGSDFLELDPKIQNGEGGYNNGDLNGDGAVDGSDFLLLDPNVQMGIGAAIP